MNDQDKTTWLTAENANLKLVLAERKAKIAELMGEAARAGIAASPAACVPPVTLGHGWVHDGDAAFNPATGERRPYDFTPASEPQHPDDIAVDAFAAAMKAKMAAARAKGRGGWENKASCSPERLRCLMRDHFAKGDPVDVGNFAMMLFNRGESTNGSEEA